MLGIQKPETRSGASDRNVIKTLNEADRNNTLTATLVINNSSGLNDGDFGKFMTRVQSEINDGFKDAKQYFRTKLSYNENADTSGAAGKSLQLMIVTGKHES